MKDAVSTQSGQPPGDLATPFHGRKRKTGHGRIPETGHDRILQRPIDSIRPSPENQKLYRSVDPGDPDRELKELPRDLGQRGLLEPIVANAELDAEKQDAVFLEAKRRQVHESLTDVFAGDVDDED